VLGRPGHVHAPLHAVNAPPALLGGQVRLPGGSHCSPGSVTPFPQSGAVVDVVSVVDVVEVEAAGAVDVDEVDVVVVVGALGFFSDGTQRAQALRVDSRSVRASWVANWSTRVTSRAAADPGRRT
jgi:hypothetical protein